MSQLGEAYSILGQATTAEYKRRRKEEEEYRKRARRDQLLGYVLAPIGQEIGKGVSDIISAPFKDATEKFLATEQGRALNKDMNVLKGWAERTNALDKIILKDYGGDARAYNLGLAENAITKQVKDKYLSLGISPDELNDKNSEAGRAFRIELQQELKAAPSIADRETAQYLDFKSALSGYKKGQDAKEVVDRYKPYASGPLGGIINVGKRFLSGVSFSEAISGPTKAEKEKAVREARQALNLTEEEFASLSSKASAGLSFALLEKEMDRIATSKNPGIERVRASIKQTDELEAAFFAGTLPPSYAKNYRKFQTEKERRPSLDELLFYIEEKEGTDFLGFSENKRGNLISQMSTVSSVAALKTEFTDNVLKQLGYTSIEDAPEAVKGKVDGKWNNILNSALYSAQLEFAAYSHSAPEDNPLLAMSSSEKERLIVQNAIDKLSSLERKPAKEGAVDKLKKFFDVEVIPTAGDFTGAFNPNAINTASTESVVTEIIPKVGPPDLGTLPPDLEQNLLRRIALGDEAGAREELNLPEQSGFRISPAFKKLILNPVTEEEVAGPLTQEEKRGARSRRGTPISLTELFPLPEGPSNIGRMRGQRTAEETVSPQEVETISPIVQGPTVAQKMDSLLADIGVDERDLKPTPRTSFESSPSSFVADVERRTNRLDIPDVKTKTGRGVISKMKQEVKEQLGVELSRKETQQVIDGLIDPSEDQIQNILDILSKRPPIKGMTMEPSEDQIFGLLNILENIVL